MTTGQKVLVLKDSDGNYYVLHERAIEAGRVPADKTAELEQAITGQDVSGFLFGFDKINVANITQSNQQLGANIVAGGFVYAGPQTLVQLASNTANVGQA
jgi:hypothetical protein